MDNVLLMEYLLYNNSSNPPNQFEPGERRLSSWEIELFQGAAGRAPARKNVGAVLLDPLQEMSRRYLSEGER